MAFERRMSTVICRDGYVKYELSYNDNYRSDMWTYLHSRRGFYTGNIRYSRMSVSRVRSFLVRLGFTIEKDRKLKDILSMSVDEFSELLVCYRAFVSARKPWVRYRGALAVARRHGYGE